MLGLASPLTKRSVVAQMARKSVLDLRNEGFWDGPWRVEVIVRCKLQGMESPIARPAGLEEMPDVSMKVNDLSNDRTSESLSERVSVDWSQHREVFSRIH